MQCVESNQWICPDFQSATLGIRQCHPSRVCAMSVFLRPDIVVCIHPARCSLIKTYMASVIAVSVIFSRPSSEILYPIHLLGQTHPYSKSGNRHVPQRIRPDAWRIFHPYTNPAIIGYRISHIILPIIGKPIRHPDLDTIFKLFYSYSLFQLKIFSCHLPWLIAHGHTIAIVIICRPTPKIGTQPEAVGHIFSAINGIRFHAPCGLIKHHSHLLWRNL